MRRLFVVLLLAIPQVVLAQAGAGALEGLGRAGQQLGDYLSNSALLQQQSDAEIRRLRQQHDLEQQRLDRQAQTQGRDEIAIVNAAHPGWSALVTTQPFRDWHKKQPSSVQRLASSPRAEDAILMLDLYKRDQGRMQ